MNEMVLVLDLDDTLYLERDYVRSGFAALQPMVAALTGITDFEDRAWRRFEAGERRLIFNSILTDVGCAVSDSVVNDLVHRYRSHQPSIRLPDDAKFLLNWADTHAVQVAILTDGLPVAQRAKLEALRLLDEIDVIVITDELGGERFRKPNIAGFSKIMESFSRGERARFLYVGDNPEKDADGASRAGWDFIRIRRPLGLHFDQPTVYPTLAEVPSLRELTALLHA